MCRKPAASPDTRVRGIRHRRVDVIDRAFGTGKSDLADGQDGQEAGAGSAGSAGLSSAAASASAPLRSRMRNPKPNAMKNISTP